MNPPFRLETVTSTVFPLSVTCTAGAESLALSYMNVVSLVLVCYCSFEPLEFLCGGGCKISHN